MDDERVEGKHTLPGSCLCSIFFRVPTVQTFQSSLRREDLNLSWTQQNARQLYFVILAPEILPRQYIHTSETQNGPRVPLRTCFQDD